MALTEIYIKLAVSFPNDPKVRGLARYGADAGLARDLYVQMCLYCKDMLSDGFVPAEQVGLLVYPLDAEHGNQLAKQLASVGLTKEVSKNEASGWEVLAFTRRNGTREDVERLSKVRAVAGAAGGRKSRKRPARKGSEATGKQVANQVGQQTGSNAVSVSANAEPETTQTPTVSGAVAPTDTDVTAQTILAEYIDRCQRRPPAQVLGHLSKLIRQLLVDDGFEPDDVRRGMAAWKSRNLHPSTLPSVVNEVVNGETGGARQATSDRKAAETQALKGAFPGSTAGLTAGRPPNTIQGRAER